MFSIEYIYLAAVWIIVVVHPQLKLISYMDEKEEKEGTYLIKLCRWDEANLLFKKLIVKRYSKLLKVQ